MKPESIHIQRDPHRKQRGYYTIGSTAQFDRVYRKLQRPPFDPEQDCDACRGGKYVFDEEVNKHRSHYMRYSACKFCGGTGRKQNGG